MDRIHDRRVKIPSSSCSPQPPPGVPTKKYRNTAGTLTFSPIKRQTASLSSKDKSLKKTAKKDCYASEPTVRRTPSNNDEEQKADRIASFDEDTATFLKKIEEMQKMSKRNRKRFQTVRKAVDDSKPRMYKIADNITTLTKSFRDLELVYANSSENSIDRLYEDLTARTT